MTKYYTMKQCFDLCGDEDIPFIGDGYNNIHRRHQETKKALEGYHSLGLSTEEIFSIRWQIKRAEPKVLSARDMRIKMGVSPKIFEGIAQIDDYGEAMDKNGQLREWLRPEQVALRNFVENLIGDHASYRHDAARVFENLKPPNEEK